MIPDVVVVPILVADLGGLLERIGLSIALELQCTVRAHPTWFDAETAFDPSRGQYRSTLLLERLLDGPVKAPCRILGVAGVDLCTPVLTFVFGEAQLDGRAAVVSLHRLRPEVYGLPRDDGLLLERLNKEALHELGHTFGLVHCEDPRCVMRASTYVEQIDTKSAGFCVSCLEALRVDDQSCCPRAPSG